MALQGALILIQVSWLTVVFLYAGELVWGGMAVGGIFVGGASWLAARFQSWEYSEPIFRLLPPLLFAVLLIYETIRLRSARRGQIQQIPSEEG